MSCLLEGCHIAEVPAEAHSSLSTLEQVVPPKAS